MTNTNASPRSVASIKVMRALAINAVDAPLIRDESGEAQIIVSLPSEYASEVLARVRAVGGDVNVIIAYSKTFELMVMRKGTPADSMLEINRDLSMGMLALKIKENPGKSIRLKIRDQSSVEIPADSVEFEYA